MVVDVVEKQWKNYNFYIFISKMETSREKALRLYFRNCALKQTLCNSVLCKRVYKFSRKKK